MDVSPDRFGYSAARNTSVKETLAVNAKENHIDGIMWVDSDIIAESDSIFKLLCTAKRYGLDFVSGIYHQREGDYQPCIYNWGRDKNGDIGFLICDGYPEKAVAPQSGCGFGFVYTSVKLLQDIQKLKHFDMDEGGWFPDHRDSKGWGEDLAFCRFAMDAGYQLYIDTGVLVGHMGGGKAITREDFLKRKADIMKSEVSDEHS